MMNEKNIKKWEIVRTKGKQHFIWFNGVFIFGICMASGASIGQIILSEENILIRIIINFIVWPIGGYFYGVTVWIISEKRYLKAKNKLKKLITNHST